MQEVPFRTVYIHALLRDEKGAKMSKSKGNVIDPLHLIDDYGADALRFTLAALAAQGRDVSLSTKRVEGYRNFATKIWNACRFAEVNNCATVPGFNPASAKETLNRWIAHETARAVGEVTAAIETYKFNEAAAAAYRFVWNIYCDWYLELVKPVLLGPDGAAKTETRATVAWARDEILKVLHPFMPFITEELWEVTAGAAQRLDLLALTRWPAGTGVEDPQAEAEIGWVVDLVSAIRSVRAEMNVAPRIGRRLQRNSRPGGALAGIRAASGAGRRHLVCGRAPARIGSVADSRRGRGFAVERRHRPCGRACPAREGTGQGRGRHQARRRQARERRFPRARARGGGRRRAREARGSAGAPG
jgi:valyl-tRNA synthetase